MEFCSYFSGWNLTASPGTHGSTAHAKYCWSWIVSKWVIWRAEDRACGPYPASLKKKMERHRQLSRALCWFRVPLPAGGTLLPCVFKVCFNHSRQEYSQAHLQDETSPSLNNWNPVMLILLRNSRCEYTAQETIVLGRPDQGLLPRLALQKACDFIALPSVLGAGPRDSCTPAKHFATELPLQPTGFRDSVSLSCLGFIL